MTIHTKVCVPLIIYSKKKTDHPTFQPPFPPPSCVRDPFLFMYILQFFCFDIAVNHVKAKKLHILSVYSSIYYMISKYFV